MKAFDFLLLLACASLLPAASLGADDLVYARDGDTLAEGAWF